MEKFLVSVADCYLYDVSNGDLLAVGKSLIDTSLETSLANVDIRAGRGNPLRYVYFHSPELKITLNDAQWNLGLLSKNVGSPITTGNNVFKEESVTLGAAGAGTVAGTPLATFGTDLFGWVTLKDGITTEKVTFTGSNFTCTGAEADVVTVRYYVADAASKQITISASMVPSIVRLVMEAQLCSKDASTNKIGVVQFEIPRASMQGSFTLSMAADGVSSTPLSVRAFSYLNTDGTTILGKVTEILDSTYWYTDCTALAVEGGDFSLAALATKTLVIRGIHKDGSVSVVSNADLDFTSATPATATVGLHTGIVTGVAAGTSLIHVTATSKNALDAYVTVTVPA